MSNWVNLSEGVNLDYLKQRKVGDVLGFKQEHTVQHYKIVRINKKSGRYWATRVTLSTEEQARDFLNGLTADDVKSVKDLPQ